MASKARSDFLQRIRAFDTASQQPHLISTGPNPSADPARLLRNGLMIVGFAALEDFIRSRTGEVLAQIRGQTTPFGDLPDAMRSASTDAVVRSFASMLPIWRRAGTSLDEIQSIGASLASTKRQPYRLSPLGLFALRNVSKEDIADGLKAFGVTNVWPSINSIAARAALPGLALSDEYDAAHNRRNEAAHDGQANVLQGDLQGFAMPAIAIALGYDALISRAARLLSDGTMTKTSLVTINSVDIRLRTIDRLANGWEEVQEGGPAVASGNRLSVLRSSARQRALVSRDLMVIRPATRIAVEWETTDLG